MKLHDGRPMTTEDVVSSLERARSHPGTGMASCLVEVESVRAVDAVSVEVRTRRPLAALLARLTPIAMVPRDAPERISRPVRTGSYRLDRARPDGMDLSPLPDCWRRTDGRLPLTFVAEADPALRVGMLLAGEACVAADLTEDAVEVLRGPSAAASSPSPVPPWSTSDPRGTRPLSGTGA